MRQDYDEGDGRRHFQWLAEVFQDRRYIRVAGKPIFLVYRTSMLPDPLGATSLWREEARKLGIGEIYLCKVENFSDERYDPRKNGFDAAVEFQPDWVNLGDRMRRNRLWSWASRLGLANKTYRINHVYHYATVVERMLQKSAASYIRYPCVTPSWDNTPRRQFGGVILRDSTPELYEEWLRKVIAKFEIPSPEENLVFINAWNEWGEGNHLEPDQKWGHAYLEATRRAILSRNSCIGE
jgi:hypothetical protein